MESEVESQPNTSNTEDATSSFKTSPVVTEEPNFGDNDNEGFSNGRVDGEEDLFKPHDPEPTPTTSASDAQIEQPQEEDGAMAAADQPTGDFNAGFADFSTSTSNAHDSDFADWGSGTDGNEISDAPTASTPGSSIDAENSNDSIPEDPSHLTTSTSLTEATGSASEELSPSSPPSGDETSVIAPENEHNPSNEVNQLENSPLSSSTEQHEAPATQTETTEIAAETESPQDMDEKVPVAESTTTTNSENIDEASSEVHHEAETTTENIGASTATDAQLDTPTDFNGFSSSQKDDVEDFADFGDHQQSTGGDVADFSDQNDSKQPSDDFTHFNAPKTNTNADFMDVGDQKPTGDDFTGFGEQKSSGHDDFANFDAPETSSKWDAPELEEDATKDAAEHNSSADNDFADFGEQKPSGEDDFANFDAPQTSSKWDAPELEEDVINVVSKQKPTAEDDFADFGEQKPSGDDDFADFDASQTSAKWDAPELEDDIHETQETSKSDPETTAEEQNATPVPNDLSSSGADQNEDLKANREPTPEITADTEATGDKRNEESDHPTSNDVVDSPSATQDDDDHFEFADESQKDDKDAEDLFESAADRTKKSTTHDDDFGDWAENNDGGDWGNGSSNDDDAFADFGDFNAGAQNGGAEDDFGDFPETPAAPTPTAAHQCALSTDYTPATTSMPAQHTETLSSGRTSILRGSPSEVIGKISSLLAPMNNRGLKLSENAIKSLEHGTSLESMAAAVSDYQWQAKDSKRAPKPVFRGTIFESQFLSAIGKQPLPTADLGLAAFIKRTPSVKGSPGSSSSNSPSAIPFAFAPSQPLSASDSASLSAALGLTPMTPTQHTSTTTSNVSDTGGLLSPTPLEAASPPATLPMGSINIPLAPMDLSMFGPAPVALQTPEPVKEDSSWMNAFMGPSNPDTSKTTTESSNPSSLFPGAAPIVSPDPIKATSATSSIPLSLFGQPAKEKAPASASLASPLTISDTIAMAPPMDVEENDTVGKAVYQLLKAMPDLAFMHESTVLTTSRQSQ